MKRLYGIIGDPIEHTLSPDMHQFWYHQDHVAHHYHVFHVTKDQLETAVQGIKALGISGCNVTIPHKVAIIPFLDDLDDEARMLGAVNTVVNKNGKLIGYNTDGLGFLRSLEHHQKYHLPDHPQVLVIGAGGAGQAIALTMAKYGARCVDITNRTIEKAVKLSRSCQVFCESNGISLTEAENGLEKYDVIVNATSIGLSEHDSLIPIPIENSKSSAIFVDIIYNFETKWLRLAKQQGKRTLDGLPMLIFQGAISYKHWLGHLPKLNDMDAFLRNKLEERHANE
ncbi:shikimate dehydrogenase [Terrilactibacillus sp. BCM23-1]|uniref:Shikimate dehydrogenase (NADP(+)) n=1 Tax=Terrilactibacillus tamarindi TaxID=2599694 RepID=A0A6N8CQP7_9BACI|nr:shikimate dehydrogenase [Terrilactibacillus tamarindi]MTT32484.1 shikimate dehydrogenase [Terrilactibacillus tamarindi]